MRVLIAGGGTGGHVIPALAIAKELRDRYGAEVQFVGTRRGLETRLVPEAGFPVHYVQVGMLANVSLMTRIKTMGDLPRAIFACSRLISQFKPDLVIGVGGYASGPGMLAAILRRVPTMAFEPNAVPGMVNRYVGRWVTGAAVSFEATKQYFRNAHVTGRPVRKELFAIAPKTTGSPRLLVMGGSQGARVLNTVMPQVANDLLAAIPGLTIVHQAGERNLGVTAEAYAKAVSDSGRCSVAAFLKDTPAAIAAADLILCRSGGTVEELCAAGRPSVLVPFAAAADNHQQKNAEAMVEGGASVMILEKDLNPVLLLETLRELLLDVAKLEAMSEAARRMSHPHALEQIAELAVSLARK